MRKEEVSIKEDIITITITYKERKYANQPKLVYAEPIENLIPNQFAGKVKLIKKPAKEISNIKNDNFSLVGEWQFQIIKESSAKTESTKSSPKRRTSTRRSTRKKSIDK